MICNNPIRVKFVIINVNTVRKRSSQQNVAFRTFQLLLYSKMGNYACNSRFSILKYTSNFTLDFYSDSNRVKEIYFGDRETARPRDLSTSAICYLTSSRFVYFNEEMHGTVFRFRMIY